MGVSHVAVQFPLYEQAKAWAGASCSGVTTMSALTRAAVQSQGETDPSDLSPSTILLCSAFSKMVASLATYPHEVLRTRLQIRKSVPNTSTSVTSPAANAARSAIATGVAASSAGPVSVPPVRPTVHPLYSPLVAGSSPPIPLTSVSDPTDIPRLAAPVAAGQGGAATPANSKSPFTRNKGGVLDTIKKIKRQDGWRGFYRGLSINLIRTVPNSAVTMLTWVICVHKLYDADLLGRYELIMRRLSLPFDTSVA